jgi:hypothetical protein
LELSVSKYSKINCIEKALEYDPLNSIAWDYIGNQINPLKRE